MAPKYEESLTGKTFEKCRILAKLGTGGMGSVWLAEHFGLGRKVAVKILPPEMGRDPEYVARFMREATTAGRMEHPNIVQIHDVGYAEGRHFIVMQYVDGESLSTVVENLGAMEPRDAAKIASGMLRGLQHAHEEGVVHRDVKPDNVLITKGDEPKLLDFGLAIETETALQITKDGMVVGTPYYLAPEQARGQKATPLCDVYAAGVTLYYLLTGKRPFVGATALAVLNKHIHEPPVPPMKHKADIPKPLNDIVLKMMAKKPADRYQSAGAAADDLDAFLKGKQIQVRVPVQLPFGLDRLSKKQQILAFSGAGSAVLLLLIMVVVMLSGGTPKPTKGGVQPPKPAPVAEAPESTKLLECLKFEQRNKDNIDAYPEVFNTYDLYINSTASPAYVEKGRQAKKAFYDFVEKRANDELEKILKETDPYLRLKALARFPRTLQDLTAIDKRLREERNLTAGAAEAKYLEDERKLDAALREGRFKDAAKLLDGLLVIADGARLQRLDRLKTELPRMEREFEDAVLRRLTQDYAAVHADFAKSLAKRENAAAYTRVTRFLKELDEVEKLRARVAQGVNYDAVLTAVPDPVLTDAKLGQVRLSLVTGFAKAQDALPYRILADLQDALDVEFLIRSTGLGLRELSRGTTELRLATFGSTGRITIGEKGLAFAIKNGPTRTIVIKELQPLDLVTLAAAAESQTVDQVFESNEQLCRAAGAAYLYSDRPERWAQAARWYRRAEQLGTPGLGFRLEGFREQGYQEVRDRIASSRKELERKNFDAAKALLSAIEAAWDHDPVLKEEIGRAMAAILTAEVLQHDRSHDYAKLKAAARTLRTKYQNLYQEDVIFGPYAHAMRETGDWQPAGSLFNNEWTWEGKDGGAPAPADDDTKAGRGLRLKPGKTIELAPVKTRGASGATVMVTVANTFSSFTAGLRFDAAKDGSYRRLVVRDTGELTLYAHDGREETRSATQPIGKKIAAGQWVELTFVAEGGDIVCYFEQRPLILFAAAVPTDRDIGLCCTAEANFRLLKLRK